MVNGESSRFVSSVAYGGAEGSPKGIRQALSRPTSPRKASEQAVKLSRNPMSMSDSGVGSGRLGSRFLNACACSAFDEELRSSSL